MELRRVLGVGTGERGGLVRFGDVAADKLNYEFAKHYIVAREKLGSKKSSTFRLTKRQRDVSSFMNGA